LEHLHAEWSKIAAKIRGARHILFLTDYDGTLTPIVEKPELAVLSEETRQLLRALSQQHRLTVGVISGRALPDLKEKVNIAGLIYAGNHGLEIQGPGIDFVNPIAEELKPFLRIIHSVLSRALGSIRGVLVENKGLSISIHYRLAGENRVRDVEKILNKVVGGIEAAGKAKITRGKKVLEVRPAVAWDKGKAIKLLMKKYGKGGRRSGLLPIYFGDDLTDEDGFKVIENYGDGISVFVGETSRNTNAGYFLKSPDEVTIFLGMLLKEIKAGLIQLKPSQIRKKASGGNTLSVSPRTVSPVKAGELDVAGSLPITP
jgi:trehalose 6-phosphate phosphatase